MTRRWVFDILGADTPIQSVNREACRELIDLLRQMPQHARLRFPNMNTREAIPAAAGQPDVERINSANTNAYLNEFAGFTNWAAAEGYIASNPAKGCGSTMK